MTIRQTKSSLIYSILFFTLAVVGPTDARHRCIWATGSLQCRKDPSKQANVEVRAYDRDGFSIFKVFDPDDLMGVTFTNDDGTFQLDGCGSDMNWLPGLENNPDPYIRIRHYCNSELGENLELPEFYEFVPNSHDVGIIDLDLNDDQSESSFTATKKPSNRNYYNYRTSTARNSVTRKQPIVEVTTADEDWLSKLGSEDVNVLLRQGDHVGDETSTVTLGANDLTTSTRSAGTVTLESDDHGGGSSTTRQKTIFDD